LKKSTVQTLKVSRNNVRAKLKAQTTQNCRTRSNSGSWRNRKPSETPADSSCLSLNRTARQHPPAPDQITISTNAGPAITQRQLLPLHSAI
jgi:hypothetical protein